MKSSDSVLSKHFKGGVFKFHYKSYFPLGFQVAGVLLGVGGFKLLEVIPLLGVLLIFGFIVTLIAKDSIEINLNTKEYRDSISIFGVCVGKWLLLPSPDYISIFPTRVSQTMSSVRGTNQTTINELHLRINIVYGTNRRLHVFSAVSIEEAHLISYELSAKLDCGIYDCSGDENVWLVPR